jgi:DNA replication protein DnaC
MNEELAERLKYLRLGGLLANWNDYLKTAAKKRYSHARLLTHIIDQEYQLRQDNACKRRLAQARIPEHLNIETFPFNKQPKLNRKMIMALYDGFEYITANRNIIWLGPTGCGKTGLATAFLTNAIVRGYTGRYVLFAELINQFYKSMADYSQEKLLKRYMSCDCLLIDEMGYVPAEPVQIGLFFTLMQKRHKNKCTLVTSNLGFSEWGKFLHDDHLTAALIDRLTENSHVINMKGCVSLRAKRKPNT